MRRRRASAPSSVSLGGLRSSLRLLLCPPSLPSSHFPSPGVSRPRLVLLQEQRSTPRRRWERHPRLRLLPASRPRRRLQGVGRAPPQASARLGPTAPASRASPTPALLPTQGEWWGAGGGCLAARAGSAGGSGGGDLIATELRRSPSGPPMAASGGGEPARQLRKHKDGGVILSSWPKARLHAPGLTRSSTLGETIPGVRPPGVRAPGLPRVGPGRPRRRPAWAAQPVETKRWWRRPHPRPRSPHPPSSPPPRGAVQGRGSTQGEGPACPAELLLRMTQWFLEKALLGFPE